MSDTPETTDGEAPEEPQAAADSPVEEAAAAETPAAETETNADKPCPCGSGKTYTECCGPFIAGDADPQTAEALMRSRYTAYAVCAVDYLRDSMHPDTRDRGFDRDSVEQWSKHSEWLGIEVLNSRKGTADDDEGTVEFIARYKDDKTTFDHHETSQFRKHNGRWYFVDGRMMNEPYRREAPKIGRNEPCPCGSGKKYKKCCAR